MATQSPTTSTSEPMVCEPLITQENHDPFMKMVRDAAGLEFDWNTRDESEAPNPTAQKFFKMKDAANTPLWPGCENFSELSALSELLNIKSESNLSEGQFNQFLKAFGRILPKGHKLPNSSYSSKKVVIPLGLGVEKIDACENYCMLYWKDNKELQEFETRNVRLVLSSDGFNPHNQTSRPYSCWPVIVTLYNLPLWRCMDQPYMFLTLLVPSPRSPGRSLDVYLQPLIDDLKTLWNDGVETYDVSKKQNFQMRAELMWTISDFPAYGMLSRWSRHGKLACPYCMDGIKSFRLKHGGKPCFFDCQRQFLPLDHPYRYQKYNFTKGRLETDSPLIRSTGEELEAAVASLPNIQFGKTKDKERIEGFGETHNWLKRSIFWDLPYWNTNLIRHNLDVMHIEKNMFDNVFNTVMDVKGKTKDNVKARLDLQNIYGYASNLARCVNLDDCSLHGMKSHDCHVFMERLLPIAFRDLLPEFVWNGLTKLNQFFRDLCSTILSELDMKRLYDVEKQAQIPNLTDKALGVMRDKEFATCQQTPPEDFYQELNSDPARIILDNELDDVAILADVNSQEEEVNPGELQPSRRELEEEFESVELEVEVGLMELNEKELEEEESRNEDELTSYDSASGD
ncbi:hypothetical protein BUALT_Bualt17G0036600 [Buddleja alternifolia]|uniref:Transposase n=1 Tax=Buddleja alternifolia TaxID=168488 RepID=A0AAV6W616_9LAMI|nr:hypothetical protein BUALT_Bualt17G0036600 [Buddleja alternifolia]